MVWNPCAGANLQPREFYSIEVIFSPQLLATYSTNLFINTTAGQQMVSLTGAVDIPSQPPDKSKAAIHARSLQTRAGVVQTTYTLTATGYDGKTLTRNFTFRVGITIR